MKGYSTFPKAPALLEPHYQIVLCHIQDTRWWGLTPLQSVYSTAPADWAKTYLLSKELFLQLFILSWSLNTLFSP